MVYSPRFLRHTYRQASPQSLRKLCQHSGCHMKPYMLSLQGLISSEKLLLCHMFVSGIQVSILCIDVTKSDCWYVTVVFHVGVGM